MANPTTETALFKVRYFDAKASKRGQGVQTRTFTDRAKADLFAAGRTLYARPATVEVLESWTCHARPAATGRTCYAVNVGGVVSDGMLCCESCGAPKHCGDDRFSKGDVDVRRAS